MTLNAESVRPNQIAKITVQFVSDYGRKIKMINQSNVMSVRCGYTRIVIKSSLQIRNSLSNIVVTRSSSIVVLFADKYYKWPHFHR